MYLPFVIMKKKQLLIIFGLHIYQSLVGEFIALYIDKESDYVLYIVDVLFGKFKHFEYADYLDEKLH